MLLQEAQVLAQEVVDWLAPYCERIVVVGSIRRRRPFPRDIDIVLIPKNQGRLAAALQALGEAKFGGKKLEERIYKGVQVDLYFATPETWATLLLIRTGSKAHNIKLTSLAKIKLTSLAKSRDWHLYARGQGLFNERNERIAGDTEESIFEALDLPYAEPWDREG